jgi:hypothetical protein
VDSAGNAYLTGAAGANFPTANPFQGQFEGGFDAFVTKLNASGSALVYSTYLGGSSTDSGSGIAVDSAGNAYATGTTSSTNFPTVNPFQANYGGDRDAFVTKLNPSGNALVYSTYLGSGGADHGVGIAIDSIGNAYVMGRTTSTNFPTVNPFQAKYGGGSYDGFIANFGEGPNPSCTGVKIDRSFSNGVLDVSVAGSCDAVLTIRNNKNYWTNFTVSSVGNVTVDPIGGDQNLYAKFGLLPPSSFLPLPPGKSVQYSVKFSKPGETVTVYATPTWDGGVAAGIMNMLQAILNVIPLGGAPLLVVDDYQKIMTAFEQMPHLKNAAAALFTSPPQLSTFLWELGAFVLSSAETSRCGQLLSDLVYNVGMELLKTALREPWKLLNSLIFIFGNVRTAFFQYPAGSVEVIAQ